MATTTTRLGLRKPAGNDPVSVITDIDENMDKLDDAAGAFRGTSFPVTPFEGKLVARSDQSDRFYFWDGTTWEELIVRSTIPQVLQVVETTDITYAATSYDPGSPLCAGNFNAPISGKVAITVGGQVECTSPSSVFLSFQVFEGSDATGTSKLGSSDDRSVAQQDAFFHQGSFRYILTGLTPGAQHYIRTTHRATTAVTASIFNRIIIVEPLLN